MHRKTRRKVRPTHQHWVPQFYLRYFATPESLDSQSPQVWIFSKDHEDGNGTLTSVRNVCGKRYLYSPRQTNGERTWALDDRLNDLETLLGQIWPELAAGFVDLGNEQVRKGLALFVAVMHFRHPDMRETLEELHGQIVDFYESGPKLSDGTPAVDSVEITGITYKLDTSDWHSYKNHGKDGHDRLFAAAIQSEAGRMSKHLIGKRWSIVCAEVDTFITSDKPVLLGHMSRDRYGYGTEGTIITFPISPTRLLVMDDFHEEPGNHYYQLLKVNAGALNLAAWNGSRRFLITGRYITEVLAEICETPGAQNDG